MFSGESLFLNDFNVKEGDSGMVTFSSDFPGKILSFELKSGQSLIAQKNRFFWQQTIQLRWKYFSKSK
jgi:uncharacterized protein (AIM24 family)